jgi:hypothetical protein
MNSDVPYESAVRTSLIPLHGRKSWGQLPSLLLKIEGGGGKLVLPPFLALNLRKKTFFMKFVQKMYFLFVWYIFKTVQQYKKKSLWFQSIPLSKYPYTLG